MCHIYNAQLSGVYTQADHRPLFIAWRVHSVYVYLTIAQAVLFFSVKDKATITSPSQVTGGDNGQLVITLSCLLGTCIPPSPKLHQPTEFKQVKACRVFVFKIFPLLRFLAANILYFNRSILVPEAPIRYIR